MENTPIFTHEQVNNLMPHYSSVKGNVTAQGSLRASRQSERNQTEEHATA